MIQDDLDTTPTYQHLPQETPSSTTHNIIWTTYKQPKTIRSTPPTPPRSKMHPDKHPTASISQTRLERTKMYSNADQNPLHKPYPSSRILHTHSKLENPKIKHQKSIKKQLP